MSVRSPIQTVALRSLSERLGLGVPLVFTTASFLAAFLLFLIQPIIGKMVLPHFGGVPAVWNTCLLFFQFGLLAGYGYAHLSIAWLGVRRQIIPHLFLLFLPILALPIGLPKDWALVGDESPIPTLLTLLTLAVGLPFFVVSTSAPILQRWYAETRHRSASDPYFLYAASNLGSMVALLGYPIAIEPNLTLAEQGWMWAGAFVLLAVLICSCGLIVRFTGRLPATSSASSSPTAPPVSWVTRLRWIALAFVPSSLLLGLTTHITTDIATVPLLWIVPLALYLLSFVLVFSRLPNWVRIAFAWLMPATWLLILTGWLDPWSTLGLLLIFFFATSMVLHGELARLRPPVARLTEYYFCMSLGGVLGGVVNALLAPLLLNGFYEYQITVVLAFLLISSPWPSANREPFLWTDVAFPLGLALIAALLVIESGSTKSGWVAVVACAFFIRRPIRFGLGIAVLLICSSLLAASRYETVYQSRNFFGILKVWEGSDDPQISKTKRHHLIHGNIEHGLQEMSEDRELRRMPRSYYDMWGPIGQVFKLNQSGVFSPVGVIGLGAGAIASYTAPGQEVTFFEINPDVVKVATDPKYFTYLSECEGKVRIVLGDARLMIEREPAKNFGVIVVDAFSSDAIPIHLLTVEALDIYLDKLTDDGLIAFHISNHYLELDRVLDGLARARGLHGLIQKDKRLSRDDVARGKRESDWVLLARNAAAFRWVKGIPLPLWQPLPNASDSPVWTDDYSSLLSVLRFNKK